MNKAFVKETEGGNNRCPKCGTTGQTVFALTLQAHLNRATVAELSSTAFFCPNSTCAVAYFDEFERVVLDDALSRPVYPKHADAPICPCFGLTCQDIEDDARSGDVTRLREHLRRAQLPEAHCATASPSGQPCVAEVQRYYMRCRASG